MTTLVFTHPDLPGYEILVYPSADNKEIQYKIQKKSEEEGRGGKKVTDEGAASGPGQPREKNSPIETGN